MDLLYPPTHIHKEDSHNTGMGPLNSPSMSPGDKELMRKWARDNGKCVRQRTVRQETAGTKRRSRVIVLPIQKVS